MSERAIRAAEWSAFASLLDARAQNIRRAAEISESADLKILVLALLAISADATKISVAIRLADDEAER